MRGVFFSETGGYEDVTGAMWNGVKQGYRIGRIIGIVVVVVIRAIIVVKISFWPAAKLFFKSLPENWKKLNSRPE